MRPIKMKWFAVLCGVISGLLLPAAEEIADLQPGPHVSLAGRILTIALPDGTAGVGQPPAFRIDLGRYAGGFVIGSVKVKSALKKIGEGAGINVRVSYRADDDSHDRLGGKFFHLDDLSDGILRFPVSLDPYAKWCRVSLEPKNVAGKIEFDLDTLEVNPLFPKDDSTHICEYSDAVRNRPVRRGVMSPLRNQADEENFKVLRDWGVNLMRLQLNTSDKWARSEPGKYRNFIDDKIENVIPKVLDLGRKYGIGIIIDLHTVPGSALMTADSDGIYGNPKAVEEFLEIWRRIATRFKGHPALYGYDLINEPKQDRKSLIDYWELQKRAAEEIRKVDPETPIYVASNLMDGPLAFSCLSPLKLKNIIYQVHFYEPFDFTHFFVRKADDVKSGKVGYRSYPGMYYGTWWGPDLVQIRKKLSAVRDFERRHSAKIYVGEFSAFASAPGAAEYMNDCIRVFEEYGWDWTYHAFREADIWSVEHAGPAADSLKPVPDTLRKQVLLNAFRKNKK